MNPVLNIIGNMLGGNNTSGTVGNAQANSGSGMGSIGNILGLFNTLKGSSDPMQMIQNMARTNPQIKQAMDYVNQNGGDMQSAFYKLAKERGIDPDQVLNMLK